MDYITVVVCPVPKDFKVCFMNTIRSCWHYYLKCCIVSRATECVVKLDVVVVAIAVAIEVVIIQ